jgi:hypothetical protein
MSLVQLRRLRFGLLTARPRPPSSTDGALLPQNQSGTVTAVGCLVPGKSIRGGKDGSNDYVLARVKRGPVASVPEGTCSADSGADGLQIDNPEKGITAGMVGRWVQISGRLERERDKNPDNLRELDVLSAKLIPVVVPRQAVNTPPPAPVTAAPRPAPLPAPRCIYSTGPGSGTAGRTLPHTATTVRRVH